MSSLSLEEPVSGKPMTAARVRDLDASLRFYVDGLGFGLVSRDDQIGIAVIDAAGYQILLSGPAAGDLTPHLNAVHEVVQPGASLYAYGGDLEAWRAALEQRGIVARLQERAWGDRTLRVIDPDGYTLVFFTFVERSMEETMSLYRSGPARLDEVLEGLSEADLDRTARPASWSIRQIVHHLADTEATALDGLKMALAEPGRVYLRNAYNQNTWAGGLRYAERDIGPSVALFKTIRAHVADLLPLLPDPWERHTVDAEGNPSLTVGATIGMLAGHALEHIEEIREMR